MNAYGVSKTFTQFGELKPRRAERRGRTIGVQLVRQLICPQLNARVINALNDGAPEFVTKYLTKDGYDPSLKGYFRFGTLKAYRKTEDASSAIARFGDEKEGTQQHIFNSRSGYFEKFKYTGLDIVNSKFAGVENDVVIEFHANAYCACVSIGKYDPERVAALRKSGNSDITHFVTYDLARLRSALIEILSADEHWKNSAIIGQAILYGDKDRRWEIEKSFTADEQRDSLGIFMGLAFVKDKDRFEHENEYRLMIVDPNALGQLNADTPPYVFSHANILDAIISSGEV
jgi:hypothetical protein